MSSKISIAMATHNGGLYLQEQLASFVSQTQLPDELVVTDDCSNDETIGILKNFSATAPFEVKIIQNERKLGVVKNFERALSMCEGDVIFLSDQDDVWLPRKIATQIKFLDDNPNCMIVLCNAILCNDQLVTSKITKLQNIRNLGLDDKDHIQGCCMAIRKDFLDLALPLLDLGINHDGWIASLAEMLGKKSIMRTPLQLYRRHASNTSNGVASQPTAASEFSLFRQYGLKDATAGWLHGVHIRKQIKDRIVTRSCEKSGIPVLCVDPQQVINVQRDYLLFSEGVNKRIKVVKVNRSIRWAYVFMHLFRGNYSQFTGIKSALKDIIRP